jgi:hypothetical protein
MSVSPPNFNGNGNGPHHSDLGPQGSYPSLTAVGLWLASVVAFLVALLTLGAFFDLAEPLLYATAALGAVALACEVCGFFAKGQGRLVLRGSRKWSYGVAHVIRCIEAAFVVASPWIPIHPKLWVSLINAALFLHFRRSHKRVAKRLAAARRSEPYIPRKPQKGHAPDDGTIHVSISTIDLRRVGVGLVALVATMIPSLSGPGEVGAVIGHKFRSGTQSTAGNKKQELQELQELQEQKNSRKERTAKGSSETPGEEGSKGTHTLPSRADWNHKCAHEGEGAPPWAKQAVVKLYEGVGSAGPAFLGCTGEVHRYRSRRCGEFAWALGEDPAIHEILSLFTACRKPAVATVYKAPASGFVRRLIETESDHVVYGPPKVTAGEGDMYILQTERGTYVLVRSETGGESVHPYIELPPPVVQAWLGAMNEGPEWLWPTEVKTVGSEQFYVLSENEHPETALPQFTITVRGKRNEEVATRGTYKYFASERWLASTQELEQDAEEAKSHPR